MISNRMNNLLDSPSAIIEGTMACAQDPYSENNKSGYLNFGIAENHLMSEELLPLFKKATPLSKEDIQYFDFSGTKELRLNFSNFFNEFLNIRDMNPENIVFFNGLSSACECLAYSLFNNGDLLMMPSPYYTGFKYDFQNRFNVKFLDVPLKQENYFKHTVADFEQAYENCTEKEKVKALLITHPHNPTGEVLSEEFLIGIVNFAKKNKLEIISDEIYALTRMDEGKHQSIYNFSQDYKEHIHFMYGLAKDFSLAGLKVGVFYSENKELVKAMATLTYFHNINSLTQRFLEKFISNFDWINNFLKTNNQRLKVTKDKIISGLPQLKTFHGESGLFVFIDLREYLLEPTFESEMNLFSKLLNTYKIFLTPGKELGLSIPGYFRLCFAKEPQNVDELISRLKKFLIRARRA